MSQEMISRRTMLLGALAIPFVAVPGIAGCTSTPTGSSTSGSDSLTPDPAPFFQLQDKFDARLGVWAHDLENQRHVEFQADDRFAFCSTSKAFAAGAVLDKHSIAGLNQVIHYTKNDVVTYSPITEKHAGTGMTLRELCVAAVSYSDNTAMNLLLKNIGGPSGFQEFLRSLGDDVSDSSRIEPALTSAIPGDIRDTTTPRVWGQNLEKLSLGNVLSEPKRDLLNRWLVGNTVGDELIRAGVPQGWRVGDKSGAGDYGTRNDIAIVWPPDRAPIVIAIMSSRPNQADKYDNKLISETTSAVVQQLT